MASCFSDIVPASFVIECPECLSVRLRVDGGVSSNDFVMQLTADLFGRKVARPQHVEMSCLGAAFVAGLGVGKQTHSHTRAQACMCVHTHTHTPQYCSFTFTAFH